MYIAGTLAGTLILLADIWAISRMVRTQAPRLALIVWSAVILLLPFVGVVAWILFGPS